MRTPMGAHILIVDDSSDNLVMLRRVLSQAGYRVTVAMSMHDALRMATQYRPDLIVTDLRMPGGTGLDLLDTMRSREGLARIPTVLVSASYPSDEERDAALARGAAKFIVAPLEPSRILDEIKGFLPNHP
jgi:adenylate cyclase